MKILGGFGCLSAIFGTGIFVAMNSLESLNLDFIKLLLLLWIQVVIQIIIPLTVIFRNTQMLTLFVYHLNIDPIYVLNE